MRESEQNSRDVTEDDQPQLEKKDPTAMWLAGLLTIGVPCLLLIMLIMGVTLLIFGR